MTSKNQLVAPLVGTGYLISTDFNAYFDFAPMTRFEFRQATLGLDGAELVKMIASVSIDLYAAILNLAKIDMPTNLKGRIFSFRVKTT